MPNHSYYHSKPGKSVRLQKLKKGCLLHILIISIIINERKTRQVHFDQIPSHTTIQGLGYLL